MSPLFIILFSASGPSCHGAFDCAAPGVCDRGVCVAPLTPLSTPPAATGPANNDGIKLMIAGTAILVPVWTLTWVFTSMVGDRSVALAASFVPVVGPFLEAFVISQQPRSWLDFSPISEALLVFDGVLQVGGIAMLIAGGLHLDPSAKLGPVHVSLAPAAIKNGTGLALVGRF